VDQVGVKAPGKPTNRIDLSLAKSAKLCFSGGNPRCNSTLGSWSPTDANPRRDADGAAANATILRERLLPIARRGILETKTEKDTNKCMEETFGEMMYRYRICIRPEVCVLLFRIGFYYYYYFFKC